MARRGTLGKLTPDEYSPADVEPLDRHVGDLKLARQALRTTRSRRCSSTRGSKNRNLAAISGEAAQGCRGPRRSGPPSAADGGGDHRERRRAGACRSGLLEATGARRRTLALTWGDLDWSGGVCGCARAGGRPHGAGCSCPERSGRAADWSTPPTTARSTAHLRDDRAGPASGDGRRAPSLAARTARDLAPPSRLDLAP